MPGALSRKPAREQNAINYVKDARPRENQTQKFAFHI